MMRKVDSSFRWTWNVILYLLWSTDAIKSQSATTIGISPSYSDESFHLQSMATEWNLCENCEILLPSALPLSTFLPDNKANSVMSATGTPVVPALFSTQYLTVPLSSSESMATQASSASQEMFQTTISPTVVRTNWHSSTSMHNLQHSVGEMAANLSTVSEATVPIPDQTHGSLVKETLILEGKVTSSLLSVVASQVLSSMSIPQSFHTSTLNTTESFTLVHRTTANIPTYGSRSRKVSSAKTGNSTYHHTFTTISSYNANHSKVSTSQKSLLYSSSTTSTPETAYTLLPVHPAEHRYFVVIASDDCPTLKTNKFNNELSKALSSLGVLNVTADISETKCQTKLNVNITAFAPKTAVELLEDSRRHNLTITIFNRTFKVLEVKKLSNVFNSTPRSNSTSTVISAVSKNEFGAYVAVGICFGLVLVVCVIVCIIKCCTKDSSKRLRALRKSHTPLNPEDYTLTPIPRPTSLYVNYYRNSLTGDLCSTTSAGSVGSTSPTVEQGIVQPFETSIVPLEDSTYVNPPSNVRNDSVNSAREAKSPDINKVSRRGLIYAIADSSEKLTASALNSDLKRPAGLFNPSYQRY